VIAEEERTHSHPGTGSWAVVRYVTFENIPCDYRAQKFIAVITKA
jgi:hypothetical protein